MPRPAKTAATCGLHQLEQSCPTLSLFENKLVRGWWPVVIHDEEEDVDIVQVCPLSIKFHQYVKQRGSQQFGSSKGMFESEDQQHYVIQLVIFFLNYRVKQRWSCIWSLDRTLKLLRLEKVTTNQMLFHNQSTCLKRTFLLYQNLTTKHGILLNINH